MENENLDPLGGLLDPLENSSYEIDSTSKIFEAIDAMKNKRKNEGVPNVWIKIKKPELVDLIVETYVDPEKKKILNAVRFDAMTIPEILNMCNLEPTNGYRKIKSLAKTGFIRPVGYVITRNRKKIKKYLAVIEQVKIYIGNDLVRVLVQFRKIQS